MRTDSLPNHAEFKIMKLPLGLLINFNEVLPD